ncbi:sodium/potassium-transporting ATPase subunit beta-3, partial [Lates japonicus]
RISLLLLSLSSTPPTPSQPLIRPLTAASPASSPHYIARCAFLHIFKRGGRRNRTFRTKRRKKRGKKKYITMASTEDKAANKENVSSWKDSIYNPRTGELLGRTASSWALILLFYLVFYCFLAGMFALTMWVMLLTLDDYVPRYRDRVPHPGLVIRPNSLDITFNKSDPLKYAQYVQHLESFLQSKCTSP